jgi:hypothetical protein
MKQHCVSGTDRFWSIAWTFAWSEPGCTEPGRSDPIRTSARPAWRSLHIVWRGLLIICLSWILIITQNISQSESVSGWIWWLWTMFHIILGRSIRAVQRCYVPWPNIHSEHWTRSTRPRTSILDLRCSTNEHPKGTGLCKFKSLHGA